MINSQTSLTAPCPPLFSVVHAALFLTSVHVHHQRQWVAQHESWPVGR